MAQAMAAGFEGIRDDVSWRRAHEELVRLAMTRAGLDFEEGRWLLRAFRTGAHVECGMGSFNEYVERLFGYGPRLTQEKLRVAEALEGLPETARGLESGSISFSAARELTRVAIPVTEREWLAATKNRTVREVERLVSGHRPGSRPDDVADAGAKRHVLRFDVSGETLATFREAMAKIRRDTGEALDDDAALLLFSRHVLEGPRDDGRSSYQLALTVCERCRRGTQHGRGELVEVSPSAVEMAECDEQWVGHLDAAAADAHVGTDVRAHVGTRVDADVRNHVRTRVDADVRNHVGTRDAAARAKQSIPPARRRQVLRRDGGCCQVPGCRNGTFVDVHHLCPRAEGGTNELENLVTVCGAHHRAIHEGRLVNEGTRSTGLTFRHADGTRYGGPLSPAGADLRAQVFRALTHMGFRESEAKHALARVPADPEITLKSLLGAALRELAPPRHHVGDRSARS